MKLFVVGLLSFLTLLQAESLREYAHSKGLRSIPKNFAQLKHEVEEPDNKMNREKILLGKKLFFDKNLSYDRTISCAKCHNLEKGGVDSKPTAIGYKNQENPSHLNSPTVLNTAYSKHFFWDGRAKSLCEQASGPMQAPFEMASTPELVVERVKENREYKKLFALSYDNNESINFENITKAIAVYEKTLVTRGAYDEYLDGDDDALSKSAKDGLKLFINLGCKACHFGPAVGGRMMQKFPLREYNSILSITSKYDVETNSRSVAEVELNTEMQHDFPFPNKGGFMGKDGARKFRVPILRNISKTAPYFHNGMIKSLRKAITIMAKYQVGVNLTSTQLDDLEAFLKSLDGKLVEYNIRDEK